MRNCSRMLNFNFFRGQLLRRNARHFFLSFGSHWSNSLFFFFLHFCCICHFNESSSCSNVGLRGLLEVDLFMHLFVPVVVLFIVCCIDLRSFSHSLFHVFVHAVIGLCMLSFICSSFIRFFIGVFLRLWIQWIIRQYLLFYLFIDLFIQWVSLLCCRSFYPFIHRCFHQFVHSSACSLMYLCVCICVGYVVFLICLPLCCPLMLPPLHLGELPATRRLLEAGSAMSTWLNVAALLNPYRQRCFC